MPATRIVHNVQSAQSLQASLLRPPSVHTLDTMLQQVAKLVLEGEILYRTGSEEAFERLREGVSADLNLP